jgi:hypothetical protein
MVRNISSKNEKFNKSMAIFWDVAPCNLVEVDRFFRGTYCLHHQGPATTQKTTTFIFVAVRT